MDRVAVRSGLRFEVSSPSFWSFTVASFFSSLSLFSPFIFFSSILPVPNLHLGYHASPSSSFLYGAPPQDHTFHSVEAAVTKSYKQPHAFHDAPVSRPDGPHAAQLGPDGLPLYLNRENVEAWRGVPSVASLRQQERLRQQTPSARNSTENGLSSSRIDGTGSANDNNTSLRAMLIAAQNGYKSRKRSSSSGPGSSRGSLLGEAFAVGNADNESSSHRSSGINLGKGRSKSAGRADSGEGQRSSGVSALAAQVKGNVGGSGVLRSFDKTVSFRPLPGGASFDWEEDWSFAKASNGRASASGAVGSSHSMNVAAGVGDPQDSSSDTSDESPPYASTQQHSTSTETERTAAAEAATMARLSSSLKPWQPVGKAKPVLTRPGSANTAKWAAAPRLRHRQSGSTSGSSTSSSSRKQTTAGGASEEVPEDAHRTSRSARERDAPFAQFDGEVRRRNGHSNAAASNRAAATPASSYHGSGGRGGSDSGNSNGSGNGAYSPPPLLASDDPAFTVEAARAQARAKNRGPNRQRPWAADIPTSSHAPSQGHAVTARSGTTSSTAPPATKPFLRRSSCSGPLGMSRQTSNYSSSSSSSSSSFRRFNSSSSGSGVDSAAALRQSLADGSLGVQAALEALADAVARLEAPRRPPTTRSGAAAKHTETSLAAQGFEERYTRAPEALLRDDIRVNVPSSSSARGAEVPNCSHAPTALQPHNDNLRTSARDELPVKQHASNWSLSSHQLPGPPQRAWSEFEVPEAALESDYRPPSRLHRKEHRKAFASSLHASMRPALLHEPIAVENE